MHNKFYVYLHKRPSDNSIFYIGKGTANRANSKSSRSKEWHDVVSSEGYFISSIFYNNLDEKSALLIENLLIDYHKGSIVNKHNNNRLDYLVVPWSKIVEYSRESPTGLVSKKTRLPIGHFKFYNSGVAQEVTIKHGTKGYRAHIIVMILHGLWVDSNDLVVNHKDNNPHNNIISNLEVVSRKLNSTLSHFNNDCVQGCDNTRFILREVHSKFDKKMNKVYKTNYFRVRVNIHGKRTSKRFSIDSLGEGKALRLAIEYRDTLLFERLEVLGYNLERIKR